MCLSLQITCQWRSACDQYHTTCSCACPLDVLLRHQRRLSVAPSAHSTSSTSSSSPVETLPLICPDHCRFDPPPATTGPSVCPMACSGRIFKIINDMDFDGPSPRAIQLTLVQPEIVEVMTEEELYTLAKLFGEIGGLSSFFFGFSSIFFFELIELMSRFRCFRHRSKSAPAPGNRLGSSVPRVDDNLHHSNRSSGPVWLPLRLCKASDCSSPSEPSSPDHQLAKQIVIQRPRCLPSNHDSPILVHRGLKTEAGRERRFGVALLTVLLYAGDVFRVPLEIGCYDTERSMGRVNAVE
ncbi:unnamed protein product [Protopolystoma xenopodis]|uniref:Uncharacterized protein n=1 Tax=Protopolystoma xenopodis TaxID=117903 RepID=A0A448XIC6_9PLAT|nr:unnamed protein product [Protopolystoma xenopodis]